MKKKEKISLGIYLTVAALVLYFREPLGIFFYILLLGLVTQGLNNYGEQVKSFCKSHLKYFYIPIIYILVLVVVLSSFEQFDTLILHLFEDRINLIFFALFHLPCAILIIWYLPYYLLFSANYYDKNSSPYTRIEDHLQYLNLIIPVKSLAKPKTEITDKNDMYKESENDILFHAIRRFLGGVFIVVFIRLMGGILKNVGYDTWYVNYNLVISMSILIIASFIFHHLQKKASQAKKENEKMQDPENYRRSLSLRFTVILFLVTILSMLAFSIFKYNYFNFYNVLLLGLASIVFWKLTETWNIQDDDQKQWKVKLVVDTKWAWLVWSSFILGMLFIFGLIGMIVTLDVEAPLQGLHSYFILAFLFLYVFSSIAFFRRIRSDFYFENSNRLNFILKGLELVLTPVMMLLIGILSIVFIAAFAGSFVHFPTIISSEVYRLNPINIFFIFFNGLFAFLAIVNRWSIIRRNRRNIEEANRLTKMSSEVTGRISKNIIPIYIYTGIIIAILFYTKGNSYHSIAYHPLSEYEQQSIDLESYTKKFLARRDSTKPIILIASDGGGLKAAYWTLQTLQNIEAETGIYNDNVFMTSGASGGSIGLGIYAYLKAQGLSQQEIEEKIETIGKSNFLSTDFAGLLSRWPLYLLPESWVSNKPDRMKIMSKNYFNICQKSDSSKYNYELLDDQPFHYLWAQEKYKLPLYVANTTHMESGRKGLVHPLDHDKNKKLLSGFIDISTKSDSCISFSDGLFTTNRFPVFSPYAKIKGKGHFFDAGGTDNSGIGTILHFLEYMKSEAQKDSTSVFNQFLDTKIILLSIRSARSRYLYEHFYEFKDQSISSQHISYPQALISSVSNVGLTAIPRYYDDILNQPDLRAYKGIDEFHKLSIPFYIDNNSKKEISNTFRRNLDLDNPAIQTKIDQLNKTICNCFNQEGINCDNKERPIIVDPPLARLLTAPSRSYIQKVSKLKADEFIVRYGLND